MLSVKVISGFLDRQKIFDDFNHKDSIFIVSDIKSKISLKKQINQKFHLLSSEKVFRASEFWHFCLNQLVPEKQVVSQLDLNIYFADFLNKNPDLKKQIGNQSLFKQNYFFDCFYQLFSFLKRNDDALKDWFKTHTEAFERWGSFYNLAKKFWAYLDKKHILPDALLASFLVDKLYFKTQPKFKKIFVDLSWSLNWTEKELFEQLGTQVDVCILSPQNAFAEHDSVYLDLKKQAYSIDKSLNAKTTDSAVLKTPLNVSAHVLNTQVSEVKFAVSKVREFFTQGVSLNEIAIVAPKIESYWVCLKHHLKFEGIPFQKEEMMLLNSFSDIQKWISSLRLAIKEPFSFSDLESIFYFNKAFKKFNEFKKNCSFACTQEDLKNFNLYQDIYIKDVKLSFKDFLEKALTLFPKEGNWDLLEKLFSNLGFLDSETLHLPKKWFLYLIQMLSKQELEFKALSQEGILILSLDALSWQKLSHVVFLGALDAELKQSSQSNILKNDEQKLIKDLGFYLNKKDPYLLEKEFKQMLYFNDYKKLLILSSEHSFVGESQSAPASFLGLEKTNQNDFSNNRFEQLVGQKTLQDVLQDKFLDKSCIVKIENTFAEDLEKDLQPLKTSFSLQSFSASTLQDYAKCPFILCAKKFFKLKDDEDISVDVGNMLRGQLVHKIFEEIVKKKDFFNLSDTELENLISAILQEKISLEKNYTSYFKFYLLEMAKNFIQTEKNDLAKTFCGSKILKQEEGFHVYFDLESLSFQTKATEFLFKGKIDRIDQNESHYIIYDYKSEHKGWRSLITNHAYQLAIYLQSVEVGALKNLKKLPVYASLLYGYKKFKKGGYVDKEFYSSMDTRYKFNREELEQDLKNINKQIATYLKKIQKKQFEPKPFKKEICRNCTWKQMCRAKHLN